MKRSQMPNRRPSTSSKEDVSQVRRPIQISGKPVEQVLNSIHYGSPELRCLLMDECDLIFECKVCRALFRDLPNFISHKRGYCTQSCSENMHVAIAELPDEKVVVIQPQAPEETDESTEAEKEAGLIRRSRSKRSTLEETIQRIQTGELGQSHAYKVYTEAAEKLQRQKETMKVATIRTTPIPTNKNAVFIDVNMASVNIHERQNQTGAAQKGENEEKEASAPKVVTRKAGEQTVKNKPHSTQATRKSIREQKHSSELQKLLMQQLKDMQKEKQKVTMNVEKDGKKMKEKVAAQPQHKSRISLENQQKSKEKSTVDIRQKIKEKKDSESQQKTREKLMSEAPQEKLARGSKTEKTQNSESSDLNLARQNLKSLLAQATSDVKPSKTHRPSEGNNRSVSSRKSKTNTQTAVQKRNASFTNKAISIAKSRTRSRLSNKKSLICSKCNSIFSTQKSLSFHMKVNHADKRTFYPCPYCPSVFYYLFGVTRHLFRNHAKSNAEIDKMRDKLRQKAYTKSVPPVVEARKPSVRDSRRVRKSSRSADHLHTVRPSRTTANDALLLKGESEPVSRKLDRQDNRASLKPSTVNVKNESKSGVVNSPSDTSQQQKSVTVSRAERLKSRTVKKVEEANTKNSPLEVMVDSDVISIPTPTPSPTPSSSTNDDGSEGPAHTCSKCERSFGRKISYENHLKSCKGKESTAHTAATSQVKVVQSLAGTAAEATQQRGQKQGESDSATPSAEMRSRRGKSSSPSPIKEEGLTVSRANDRNKTNSSEKLSYPERPSRSRPGGSLSTSSRCPVRSSSADRSRDVRRSVLLREKRDSSVESTQSNVEGCDGRSRRDHRTVPARYASSPSENGKPASTKVLTKVKTNSGDGPSRSASPYVVRDRSRSTPRGLPRGSKAAVSVKNFDCIFKGSLHSMDRRRRSRLDDAVSKLSNKANVRGAELSKSTDSAKNREVLVKEDGSKKEFADKAMKAELIEGSSTLAKKEWFNSGKKMNETPAVPESGSRTEIKNLSSKTADKPGSRTVTPKEENIPVDASKSEMSGIQAGVKNEEKRRSTSAVQTPRDEAASVATKGELAEKEDDEEEEENHMSVVPALAERPKRKRKVPSRNLGAEDMLSKIHNTEQDLKRGVAKVSPNAEPSTKRIKLDRAVEKGLGEGVPRTAGEAGTSVESSDVEGGSKPGVLTDSSDWEDIEVGKGKGRSVSNRIYVVGKSNSRNRKLQCYDHTQVNKMVDEDNLRCLECGEGCSQRFNLRRHIIRRHLKWSRYKCKICGFKCFDRSECTTHIVRGHRAFAQGKDPKVILRYIIDLAKQGSAVRSLKKNETLQRKQQQEAQGNAGNIYARPNVRRGPRLSQRAGVKDTNISKSEVEGGKKAPSATPSSQKTARHTEKSAVSQEGSDNCDSTSSQGHIPTVGHSSPTKSASLSEKRVTSGATKSQLSFEKSVRDSKVEVRTSARVAEATGPAVILTPLATLVSSSSSTSPSKPSPSSAPKVSTVVKDVASARSGRKNLPFNISTRNSPRMFDTRPYSDPASDGVGPDTSTGDKNVPSEVTSTSSTEQDKKCSGQEKAELDFFAPLSGAPLESIAGERNIFEKMRRESTGDKDINNENGSSRGITVNVTRVEVDSGGKGEGAKSLEHEGSVQGGVFKCGENPNQLVKSLVKLKRVGDQLGSSSRRANIGEVMSVIKPPAFLSASTRSGAKVTPALTTTHSSAQGTSSPSMSEKTGSETKLPANKVAQKPTPNVVIQTNLPIVLPQPIVTKDNKVVVFSRSAETVEPMVTTRTSSKSLAISSSSSSSASSSSSSAGAMKIKSNESRVIVSEPGAADSSSTAKVLAPNPEGESSVPQGTFIIQQHYI